MRCVSRAGERSPCSAPICAATSASMIACTSMPIASRKKSRACPEPVEGSASSACLRTSSRRSILCLTTALTSFTVFGTSVRMTRWSLFIQDLLLHHFLGLYFGLLQDTDDLLVRKPASTHAVLLLFARRTLSIGGPIFGGHVTTTACFCLAQPGERRASGRCNLRILGGHRGSRCNADDGPQRPLRILERS